MAETAVQNTIKKLLVAQASRLNNFDNNFNADNHNVDNHNGLRGIAQSFAEIFLMTKPRDLWQELYNYDNLLLAYKKARKHKTKKDYVIDFEENLENNLLQLQKELVSFEYKPKPLKTFIIHDPKTRKISKSDFRDRIIHHALCNIIEPIFEKTFIFDSFANRKCKGTLNAIKRLDNFKRKASKNNTIKCYILKADIKKYFETVDRNILLSIIQGKINDKNVLWLIQNILANHVRVGGGGERTLGMPLGNLTSQFFANVYLNELDKFVKHKLKANYYIRYVDDFVILEKDKEKLEFYCKAINEFLKDKLKIELHPEKSKIILLGNSITFLGFRIFYYHKLLKKSNLRKMKNKFILLNQEYQKHYINYDKIYDFFEGWIAYAKNADTYYLRKKIIKQFGSMYNNEISTKEFQKIYKYHEPFATHSQSL